MVLEMATKIQKKPVDSSVFAAKMIFPQLNYFSAFKMRFLRFLRKDISVSFSNN